MWILIITLAGYCPPPPPDFYTGPYETQSECAVDLDAAQQAYPDTEFQCLELN